MKKYESEEKILKDIERYQAKLKMCEANIINHEYMAEEVANHPEYDFSFKHYKIFTHQNEIRKIEQSLDRYKRKLAKLKQALSQFRTIPFSFGSNHVVVK